MLGATSSASPTHPRARRGALRAIAAAFLAGLLLTFAIPSLGVQTGLIRHPHVAGFITGWDELAPLPAALVAAPPTGLPIWFHRETRMTACVMATTLFGDAAALGPRGDLPAWTGFTPADQPAPGQRDPRYTLDLLALGYPFRSFVSPSAFGRDEFTPLFSRGLLLVDISAIVSMPPEPAAPRAYGDPLPPTRPVLIRLVPLLLNALTYALAIFLPYALLFILPPALRHRSRLRANRCLGCGYPRATLPPQAPCPECGQAPAPTTLPA